MKLILGDCIEKLKELPDNSVDSIITDPPYGLTSIVKRFGKKGSAAAKFGNDGSFSRLSKGFMGKEWDGNGIEYNVDMWAECLRILKPGGHLLSFGGTRTYHRMASAIEDAGFEIRDMIEWVYGSGFPKSLNIGKSVDKLQGNEREHIMTIKKLHFSGDNLDTNEGWARPSHRNPDGTAKTTMEITKGNSPYEGWGTALKPAHEPICMARKPLSEKNVAENCLKWGTGGINIDDSRVGTDKMGGGTMPDLRDVGAMSKESAGIDKLSFGQNPRPANRKEQPTYIGRFPANLIHDGIETEWARFFYCAKASKSERDKGCEDLEEKRGGSMMANTGSVMGLGGASLKGEPKEKLPVKNNHPTVKPIKLMEYLIKMVTPKGGTVLDPFMGSGTTGVACRNLGFDFIGIEKEKDYLKIAQARIENTNPNNPI